MTEKPQLWTKMSVLGVRAVESIIDVSAGNRRRKLIFFFFSESSKLKDDSLKIMFEDKMETRRSRQIQIIPLPEALG